MNAITPDTPETHDRTNRRFRRTTAIGLTAGLLGGGAAGMLLAVPSLTSAAADTTVQATTDIDTDTDTSDVRPERGDRLRELLQALVDDTTITAEQADAVVAHITENMPERGDRGGRHGRGIVGTEVAEVLGVTTDDLRAALAAGQSIADVAEAQGVDVQVVIDTMIAEIESRLADRVADGSLTQEDADARLAEATERITERVNTAGLAEGRGDGAGRMGRHGGPFADE